MLVGIDELLTISYSGVMVGYAFARDALLFLSF